jgi:uncharacterized protein (TIGR03067 family)
MKAWVLLPLALGLLMGADSPKEKPAKSDKDKLQGTWQAVKAERDGEAIKKASLYKMVFKGDKYTLLVDDQAIKTNFKVDPGKKPKQITFTDPRKGSMLGIYELDGDKLKVCICEDGRTRPKDFSTKDGSRMQLFILKRAK